MAYGLDMTDEMLALARQNQAKAGVRNGKWMREFTGRIAGALTAAGPEVVGIVRARKPG